MNISNQRTTPDLRSFASEDMVMSTIGEVDYANPGTSTDRHSSMGVRYVSDGERRSIAYASLNSLNRSQ